RNHRHHPRHQGPAAGHQAAHPRRLQVLQPGPDQQSLQPSVHAGGVRAERPGRFPRHRNALSGQAGRGWCAGEAAHRAQQLLRQPAAVCAAGQRRIRREHCPVTSASELLESLNLLDEHERVEAKRADEVGKSLLETICAFANEPRLDGGWILLGVTREELALFPGYEVEGLEQPDKVSADLASQCATTFNQPVRIQITTEQLEDKAVIVVFVPEAQPHEKPVYFKSQGLPRGAFRRIGSTDQRCTEDDLLVLYQGRQIESFDAGIVPDSGMDDFLPEAVAEYRNARSQANPDAEELRWSDEELLQALSCIRRDSRGQWQPTVAGLILFGKPAALRRCFPMTRVDYIRVPGGEWVPDPEHRFDT